MVSSLSGVWASLRFWRAPGGLFVLSGVPVGAWDAVCARLFVLGCTAVSGVCSLASRLCSVAFRCPAAVAGRLALLVPCPAGGVPLVVGASGGLLFGAAAAAAVRSGSARLQSGGGSRGRVPGLPGVF